MAIFNAGVTPHRQYFYGKSNETKPTEVYIADKFYEFDTGNEFIFDGDNWIDFEGRATYGVATGGTDSTIIDTNKNFQTNIFDGNTIKITIDEIEYFTTIISTIGDIITIDTIAEAVTDGCKYIIFDQ